MSNKKTLMMDFFLFAFLVQQNSVQPLMKTVPFLQALGSSLCFIFSFSFETVPRDMVSDLWKICEAVTFGI